MSDYVRRLRTKVGNDLLLMPAVGAVIRDGDGRVLLVQHVEGRWQLPGGAIDPGERPAEALRRECREEIGVDVETIRLAGVFGGPGYDLTYPNGDQAGYVVAVFEARIVSGELRADSEETQDFGWFAPDELEHLGCATSTRETLRLVLAGTSFV